MVKIISTSEILKSSGYYGCDLVVEFVISMHEALGSISNPPTLNNNRAAMPNNKNM
jgi:hypothetical protein